MISIQTTTAYTKAYVEILEIINYMGKSYKGKIPKKLLNFIEENKDPNYEYKLKHLDSNNAFLKETLIILALIEKRYWATDDEKRILNQALKENEKKYQAYVKEKYNPDNVFKKQNSKVEKVEDSTSIVEYKERSIFAKIKNWLKKFLKNKNN